MSVFINGVEVAEIVAQEAVSLLKRNYVKRPTQTLLVVIGMFITISSLIFGIIYLNKQQHKKIEVGNVGIQERLQKLNDVQFTLKELEQFIDSQKQSIVNQNKLLESLKEEKSELEPIVQANRELIDKIFKQQEKRSKWEFRLRIVLGFMLGIVGSFFGSILYSSYKKYKVKNASA